MVRDHCSDTAVRAKSTICELAKGVLNYQQQIKTLSQENFAALTLNYINDIHKYEYFALEIMQYRYSLKFSLTKIKLLAKKSNLSPKDADALSMFFLIYMLRFWQQKLQHISDSWSDDEQSFVNSVVHYQKSARYKDYWALCTIKSVLAGKYDDIKINELLSIAYATDVSSLKGDLQNTLLLKEVVQSNLSLYSTKQHIQSLLREKLVSKISDAHNKSLKSAKKKLKKLYLSITKSDDVSHDISVSFDANEILALMYRDKESFAIKQIANIEDALTCDNDDMFYKKLEAIVK